MAGIYIHIPFCKQRCRYCNFFSSTNEERKDEYAAALCRELELRKEYLSGKTIETIYFGGGTPSTLSDEHFKKIFRTIEANYNITKNAETTLEANPDDLTKEYTAMLRSLPFNRLSMGVQSFNNTLLHTLDRRHDAEGARTAMRNARAAGFDNISIDLMFALPGSTAATWANDITEALKLEPEHISAYNLTYEEGTPLHRAIQSGRLIPLGEDENLEQFTELIDRLPAAGYRHYEISNFARPGRESRHNSSYWHNIPYLGCGAAAHSYDIRSRSWNISDIALYIKGINSNRPDCETEILTEEERYNDAILTRLRTADGLPPEWFKQNFPTKLYNYMMRNAEKHILRGTLTFTEDGNIRLTKEGIFISDAIMRDLIHI